MSKIKFNISPSAINLYNISPLIFYFKYIQKIKPDTKVYTCYGNAGSVVHNSIERVCKGEKDFEEYFFKQWDKNKLDNDYGFNSTVLDKNDYFSMAAKGILIFKDNYTLDKVEDVIEIPHIDNDEFTIKIKGIIDFHGKDKNGKKVIIDWKTGNSSNFEMHAKHYCYLIFRKYNVLVDRVIIHYLKSNKETIYKFTEEDLNEYHKEIKKFCDNITEKGKDISKYDLGNINWIFNEYSESCKIESMKRGNVNA